MNHDHHIALSPTEMTAENLVGVPVYGPDSEKVGVVGDLLLYGQDEVRSAVIDVGGFLGLGSKPVSVPFETLRFVRDGAGGSVHAHISWTKDELKERPEFSRQEDDDGYIVYVPPLM